MEPGKRIISLDILRGVAVLGILIMNIQSFSMPTAAYINPTAYGDLTGINKWTWILSHVLASDKFMSLFSILFGAGVLIFTENARKKGKNFAALHDRRMGWLLLFGLLHGYLLWYGDILFTYGLCGSLLFVFRKLKAHKLVWIGLGFFLVPVALDMMFTLSMPYWPEESVKGALVNWRPGEISMRENLQAYRGSWLEQMEYRIPGYLFMQTGLFFMETFWRVMSMMLLGMALFKWGVLSAQRSGSYYLRLALLGLVLGISLSSAGVVYNFKMNWSLEHSMFMGKHFNYVGSVATALGYIGLVMLLSNSKGLRRMRKGLSATGRMAFSNYILMTLICTFVFYGHGLGLYGEVDRGLQLVMVAGIWILLLLISSLWLKFFAQGPLEALWRSLTYGKRQPLKK